jgi:hypothetical protein
VAAGEQRTHPSGSEEPRLCPPSREIHLWEQGTDLRAWLFRILHHQHISSLAGPLTLIYRVLPSLIRPRAQGAPVFLMQEAYREDVMKDLKADWRRWTRVERIVAVFIALGMSSMVPVLLLLSEG